MGDDKEGGAPKPAAKPEPPKLPDGTPPAIVNFVACKAAGIRFKSGPIPFLKGKPKLDFEEGEQKGAVNVKIGWGPISLSIPVSIKDGKLDVDISKVPDLSDFSDQAPKPQDIKDTIDKLNEWVAANGRKFGSLELKDGQLTLMKARVAPAAGKAVVPGGGAPGDGKKPAGDVKPEEKKPEEKKPEGKPVIKSPLGMGVKSGLGAGALAVGFALGAFAAPDGTNQVAFGQPAGQVAVSPNEPMPVEERVVLHLPEGTVSGELSITGAQGSFTTSVFFVQEGDQLSMEVPGLAPFTGAIDDRAAFDIRSDQGSFEGTFDGSTVGGNHVFDGEPFTFTGTIGEAVVEERITDPAPVPVPLAGSVGDTSIVPVGPGEQDGGGGVNVPLAAGGAGLVVIGAGLIVLDLRRGQAVTTAEDGGPLAGILDAFAGMGGTEA